MVVSEDDYVPQKVEETGSDQSDSLFVDDSEDYDFIENDIYKAEMLDSMVDNDELSMNEAAFMMGYDDFN